MSLQLVSRAAVAALLLGALGASAACGDDDTTSTSASSSSAGGAGAAGGAGGAGGGGMDDGLTVTTDLGDTRGVLRNGAKEWRGIPYGKAPLKELRWAVTKPATPWEGVHDASEFGPACPQQERAVTAESLNEDCLSLNVSVPADLQPGEKLPVLIWIHGGAFVGGSSSLYRLDELASKGRIVVVSTNYRLGVFGFLPHPALENDGSSGNLGLHDQREAMRWVQRNIEKFGGDPTRVTVSGESAGAGSVCSHLASPELVEGLFQQAILQSSGCLTPLNNPTVASAAATGIIEKVGCKKADDAATRACMESADLKALLTAQGEYAAQNPTNLIPFAPSPGDTTSPNAIFPRSFAEALATKKFKHVPMLFGGTRHEVRLYVGYFWQAAQEMKGPAIDKDTLATTWLPLFYPGMAPGGGTYAEKVAAEYLPAGGFTKTTEPPELLGKLLSDFTPLLPITNCLYQRTAARVIAQAEAKPLYYWEFADEAAPVLGVGIAKPFPDFAMGSVHSSELNYLFPNLDNSVKIAGPDLAPKSQALSDQMVQYWASFVKNGDPATKGQPAWPKYTGPTMAMRLEPDNVGIYDTAAQHRCAFWQGLYPDPAN